MYDFTDVFCRALSAMLPPPCQVLEMRGDSFQHFGNAAIVQSIVDKLPDIAKEIAAPLSKTEKVRPGAPPLPPHSLRCPAGTTSTLCSRLNSRKELESATDYSPVNSR